MPALIKERKKRESLANSNSKVQSKQTQPESFLELQHGMGNQALQRAMSSAGIQTKLNVSQPSDSYEREADRVADEVMNMSDSTVQTKSPINIQRKPESSGGTHELSSHTESKINSLQGKGETLSSETRSFFEPRFGEDFSNVRVHTNSSSNTLANSINARAFTHGNNIVFNSSEYSPNSASGKRLLGHELAHVVQQKASLISRVSRKEEVKSNEKGVAIQVGKLLFPIILELPQMKKITLNIEKRFHQPVLKFKKFVTSPFGLTIISTSVLGFGLAYKNNLLNMRSSLVKQNFEIPQELLGFIRKVLKYDFKYVKVSAQPILKGFIGQKPREYGVMFFIEIKK